MSTAQSPNLPWSKPNPFVVRWDVEPQQIDHYNHVNNVAYVAQLERLAWLHSNALGLTIEQYQQLDRGMAISQHLINYHAPGLLGDEIYCATWIVSCDERLKLSRQFEFIRASDNCRLLSAQTDFVCIALSSGKPKRMPDSFRLTYSKACVD